MPDISSIRNRESARVIFWYGDIIYADLDGDGIYGDDDDKDFRAILKHRSITLASRQICHGKALTSL